MSDDKASRPRPPKCDPDRDEACPDVVTGGLMARFWSRLRGVFRPADGPVVTRPRRARTRARPRPPVT